MLSRVNMTITGVTVPHEEDYAFDQDWTGLDDPEDVWIQVDPEHRQPLLDAGLAFNEPECGWDTTKYMPYLLEVGAEDFELIETLPEFKIELKSRKCG